LLPSNETIDSWKFKSVEESGFEPLKQEGSFLRLTLHFQAFIASQVMVESGIAMNDALMENLFVTIICILTRIPVFVVGKPGSSKTLTMQVIWANLQGNQSPNPFWRKYPAVHIFSYQCSPMSDSHSIQHQFDMAVRYQQHAENTITVLLLDEVGLAEHSPDMPLKVLHAMLVDPPISVVGLSNWVLDPAKMNRAILLQRTEPSREDIQLTGRSIVTSKTNKLDRFMSPLANAYHGIYTQQKGRDFVGMRDFYNLVKLLKAQLSGPNQKLTATLLTTSLCRNFGGKRELLDNVLRTFHQECFGSEKKLNIPKVTDLIRENLSDTSARHLMVLTKNSVALPLLLGSKLIDQSRTKVLVGSEFQDDRTEHHLVTQINEVKLAMAEGATLVLLNHDNIYEALYDVLNQRFVMKKDGQGNTKRMLRLAIGSRSQLCNVADGFKMIVIVEQDHAYRTLDLPLLNRFEKQVLCGEDVLGPNQQKLVKVIHDWVQTMVQDTGLGSAQEVFSGYHPGTIPSAVLNLTNFDDSTSGDMLAVIQLWLFQVARPIAVMSSSKWNAIKQLDYFNDHSCLKSVLDRYVFAPSADPLGSMCMALTNRGY
jgi:E3 ubiquitin-protein ligase RNF213